MSPLTINLERLKDQTYLDLGKPFPVDGTVDASQISVANPAYFDASNVTYGAKSDERRGTDAAMTQNSATLTSATAAFTQADVGKTVSVWVTRTITDLAWTVGAQTVTSASANFTSADIGKNVEVWGDQPRAITIVNSSTQVTIAAIPQGAVAVTNGTSEISAGLLTTILSVQSSTQATLAANWTQTASISSANWTVETDSSGAFTNAINAAVAAGGGTVTVPPGTYRLCEVIVPQNVTLEFQPGTTLKLAADASSTRNIFKIASGSSSDTFTIKGATIRGRGGHVVIDMSDLQPGSGPTRAITVLNASGYLVENIRGIGLPANSGNVVHLAANGALVAPSDGTIRRIRHEGVRHVGNSSIQIDACDGLEAHDIWCDGGVALRLECAQHNGDMARHVVASRLRAGGESGHPHSAMSTTGHQNIVRDITVTGIRATGGATGHSYSYTPYTGGTPNQNPYPIERVTVRGGYIDGGGQGVGNGSPFDSGTQNIQTEACTWQDLKVVGSVNAAGFDAAGGTFIRCTAEACTGGAGFESVRQNGVANYQNAAPPRGIITRFDACHARGNKTYGFDCDNSQQWELYGCTADDPIVITTSGSNLLSAADSDLETGIGTWSAITNVTVTQSTDQAQSGTHSLKHVSTASGNTEADTASGTSGFLVTAGSTYKATCYARAGTTGANCFIQLRWYTSGGAFLSQQSGPTFVDSSSAWTPISAVLTAPATAAFAAFKITFTTTGAGEVHYSDVHSVLLTTATGSPAQNFGIRSNSGQHVYTYGGDYTRNGVAATTGLGVITQV